MQKFPVHVPESLQTLLPEGWEKGFLIAEEARTRAYVPYSQFRVGFALHLPGTGDFIPGANVENASYGATICAERSAFTALVSQKGKIDLDYGVLVTDADPPAVPCAICLQVIAELGGRDFLLLICNLQGVVAIRKLSELLPHSFVSIPDPPSPSAQ